MGNKALGNAAAYRQTTVGRLARSLHAMLATGLLPAGRTLRRGG